MKNKLTLESHYSAAKEFIELEFLLLLPCHQISQSNYDFLKHAIKNITNDASTIFSWKGSSNDQTTTHIAESRDAANKIRLVYHNSYRFRVTLTWNNIFCYSKNVWQNENPAGNLTKHVSLKSKWCCLEITWNRGMNAKKNLHGISCGRTQNRLDSNKYINLKDFPIKFWWETGAETSEAHLYLPPRNESKIKMHFCQAIKESIINRNQYTQAGEQLPLYVHRLPILLTFGLISFTIKKEEAKHLLTSMLNQQKTQSRGKKNPEGEITHERKNLLNVIADINAWHFKYPSKSTLRVWVDGSFERYFWRQKLKTSFLWQFSWWG